MARVKAFEIGGVRMTFPSGDHGPPHFHARRAGDWAARVFLLESPDRMIALQWGKMEGNDRKAMIRGVEEHRDELLQEFEACQGSEETGNEG
jgi:uncharacterized protein DUF4160